MALFGHSGSQAPQFMHSSVIIIAIAYTFSNFVQKYCQLRLTPNISMDLRKRIDAFIDLGKFLGEIKFENENDKWDSYENDSGSFQDEIRRVLRRAKGENGWFTVDSIKFSFKSWSKALTEENLLNWVSKYEITETSPKTVAVIMAGNIPLVGFHDFISVLITGNRVLVKLSSNDKVLLPFLATYLIKQNPEFGELIKFTENRLKDFDAVIATGSNNTARYFDYYFGKYPHIIRKNRNSVAVLTGDESEDELKLLADDVFLYFGLGCRNVSKIYVPENYNFDKFFNGMFSWKEVIYNNKYMNNYDYNKAIYLMNSQPLLDNEFLLLKEDTGFSSPIAVLFFERYKSLRELEDHLKSEQENIQCVVSKADIGKTEPFGNAQHPQLWDYADGVDTLEFLLKLHS